MKEADYDIDIGANVRSELDEAIRLEAWAIKMSAQAAARGTGDGEGNQ